MLLKSLDGHSSVRLVWQQSRGDSLYFAAKLAAASMVLQMFIPLSLDLDLQKVASVSSCARVSCVISSESL